jgi:hypothetical protein
MPAGEAMPACATRQHGFRKRHRDRMTSRRGEHAEAVGKTRAGAAKIIGHP